jgi:DNA-binding LacI/PurR family transcriptional regulator
MATKELTIYDIAKAAKVGIGTVSRVLNNHSHVSEQTRERVMSIAKQMHYSPNACARGLARNRTNVLLTVIPYCTTSFFTEVLFGVQEKLQEFDYDILLLGVKQPDHVEESLSSMALRGKVDGVIFCSMALPEAFAKKCQQENVPLILLDTRHEQFDSVFVENVEGALLATSHLIQLGHKHIGMLSANAASSPAQARVKGYKKALHRAGLSLDSKLIKYSMNTKLDGFTRESGHETMKQFLQMKQGCPSAIFVSSDIQALGALSAIGENDLRCPNDIAIVGFDDIEISKHIGLTTMRQPMYEMGHLAASRIVSRISESSSAPAHTAFHPELIVRKTCGGTPVTTRIKNVFSKSTMVASL